VAEVDDVARRHAFHPLRVKQVVQETADTRSFVLDVPPGLESTYRYRPGQFCTFRVRLGGDELFRCYSMSSAPDTDPDLTVTVKRVPGGVVSNWFNDVVSVGDIVDTSPPSGAFCLADDDRRPVVAFCGGSGITPVLSIAKRALSSTDRPVRLLYANREPGSVIFDAILADLAARRPERCTVRHHFDSVSGYPSPEAVADMVGHDLGGEYFVCGPGPFMELVETTLLGAGVDPADIHIERFETPDPADAAAGPGDGVTAPATPVPESLVLHLQGRRHEVPYHAGDTVLETARRAGLAAPYSCESGSCATCMALVHEGSVAMRVNNALTPDEVDEGWVLTCQSVPTSAALRIEYEQL
jgi:ferredoxin-NADP reductase